MPREKGERGVEERAEPPPLERPNPERYYFQRPQGGSDSASGGIVKDTPPQQDPGDE